MAKFLKAIIFFVISVLLLIPNFANAKTHVRINNTLADHGLDLTIHCKSKNDDLGKHVLHHFATYEFAFNPIRFITQRTLFYCSFQWNGAFKWFDIYKEKRDDCPGNLCSWKVKKDQVCMVTGPTDFNQICYPYH